MSKKQPVAPPKRLKTIFVIDVEHSRALREEALRRAFEGGSTRADASALLREILDAWMKKRIR
jgi:hypothetical protein